MKGSSRGSQGSNRSQLKTKKYVKNRYKIGDAAWYGSRSMENRGSGRIETKSQAKRNTVYSDAIQRTTKNQPLKGQDGSFKKEVRAKSQRAADVYGSKRKAMKNSYEKEVRDPTKLRGTRTKKNPGTTLPSGGGLTAKKRTSRPRKNKGLT